MTQVDGPVEKTQCAYSVEQIVLPQSMRGMLEVGPRMQTHTVALA
jgi:hypothetical protein